MPWYNNVDLDTQLRFGNVSNSPATVHVWIGGQEKTSGCTTTPANVPYPYVLAVGASLRVSCPNVNSGPVQIVSNVNIVAAERVIYNVNGLAHQLHRDDGVAGIVNWTTPTGCPGTTMWIWIRNCGLGMWQHLPRCMCGSGGRRRRVVVHHALERSVSVCPGRRSEPAGELSGVNNGPVQIISNVNIVAAERVIYNVNERYLPASRR